MRKLPAAAPLFAALRSCPQLNVFLVGGAIRDLLLGDTPQDLDIALEGPLEPLLERLDGTLIGHDRFGTATLLAGASRYDIARTRSERYPAPGALPLVEPAPIELDLRRRDFTVNAIALGLGGRLAGKLLTAARALADLEARRLAVLHERSFSDDPTRLLRMARYRARLRFELAPETAALARAAIAAGAVGTLSRARIGDELLLLVRERDPVAALCALHELGAEQAIDPLLCFDGARAALACAALTTLRAAAAPAAGTARTDLLALAVALLDAPAAQIAALLDSFELTASDRDAIAAAASGARALGERAARARTGAQIARAVGKAALETVALASALVPSQPLQRWLDDLRHRTLEITGSDLLAAGIPQGPAVGRGLAAARDAMLDDRAVDRASQLAVALAGAQGAR